MFHTLFNLINVALLIWFVPQIVSLAERMIIPSKDEEAGQYTLEYFSTSVQPVPEIAILEAKKESLTILDWRSESSFLPPSNTSVEQVDNSGIDDIYFNLNNFDATLSRLYNTEINIQ